MLAPTLLGEMGSVYENSHRRRHELDLGLSCHRRELLTDLIIGKKDKTPAICLALKADIPLPTPKKDLNTHLQERRTSHLPCMEQGASL